MKKLFFRKNKSLTFVSKHRAKNLKDIKKKTFCLLLIGGFQFLLFLFGFSHLFQLVSSPSQIETFQLKTPEFITKIQEEELRQWSEILNFLTQNFEEGSLGPRVHLYFLPENLQHNKLFEQICAQEKMSLQKFNSICKSLWQVVSFCKTREEVEITLEQLEGILEDSEKKRDKETDLSEELNLKEIEESIRKINEKIVAQENLLQLHFSKEKLNHIFAHNLKIFENNQDEVEMLWTAFFQKFSHREK